MKYIAMTLVAALFLAACGQGTTPGGDTATTPAEAQIEAVSSDQLWTEPKTLLNCDPVEVSVHWDMSSVPAVGAVELWVGKAPDAKLFAAGGNIGVARTGAWTRPGEQFVLREAGKGTDLARAVVGGPRCS